MRWRVATAALASRVHLPRTRHANARASGSMAQEMQAMQCKKAMQHFAHGCGVAAAKLTAALDQIEACASPSASGKARRALGVAQERLGGKENKGRAHGNAPLLSAASRSEAFQRWVGCMMMQLLYCNEGCERQRGGE